MKKEYTRPTCNLTIVAIEESLANGSTASFNPGGANNEPLIEEWIKEEKSTDIYFN